MLNLKFVCSRTSSDKNLLVSRSVRDLDFLGLRALWLGLSNALHERMLKCSL